MNIQLTPYEARVIGSLIEKEATTPEQYPLSLNALTNACNQKSSREPVMALSERVVQETIDGLIKKRLVSEKTGFGSRVAKYQHRLCNTDFGDLRFSGQELGVICVMLLRGPQTPGELRTRTDRLCKFGDVGEVETVLQHLMEREDGPFVARLPREPGKRESRYAHLFCGESAARGGAARGGAARGPQMPEYPAGQDMAAAGADGDRLDRIEYILGELRREIEQIKSELGMGKPNS